MASSSTRATSSVASSLRDDATSSVGRGSRASRRSVASSATLHRQMAIDRFATADGPARPASCARALAQLAKAFMEDETRAIDEGKAKADAQRLWRAGSETVSPTDHESMTVTASRNLEGIGPIADDGIAMSSRNRDDHSETRGDETHSGRWRHSIPSVFEMDVDDGDGVFDLHADSENDPHPPEPILAPRAVPGPSFHEWKMRLLFGDPYDESCDLPARGVADNIFHSSASAREPRDRSPLWRRTSTSSTTPLGSHRAIATSSDVRGDIYVAGPVAYAATPLLGPVAAFTSTGSSERDSAWNGLGVPAPTLSDVQWDSFFDGLASAAQASSMETAKGHHCTEMFRAPPGLLAPLGGHPSSDEVPRQAAHPVSRSPRSGFALRSAQAFDASSAAAFLGALDVRTELFTVTPPTPLRPLAFAVTDVPLLGTEPTMEPPRGCCNIQQGSAYMGPTEQSSSAQSQSDFEPDEDVQGRSDFLDFTELRPAYSTSSGEDGDNMATHGFNATALAIDPIGPTARTSFPKISRGSEGRGVSTAKATAPAASCGLKPTTNHQPHHLQGKGFGPAGCVGPDPPDPPLLSRILGLRWLRLRHHAAT